MALRKHCHGNTGESQLPNHGLKLNFYGFENTQQNDFLICSYSTQIRVMPTVCLSVLKFPQMPHKHWNHFTRFWNVTTAQQGVTALSNRKGGAQCTQSGIKVALNAGLPDSLYQRGHSALLPHGWCTKQEGDKNWAHVFNYCQVFTQFQN